MPENERPADWVGNERPADWVRLACDECDCDSYDGITPEKLEELKATWESICQVQTWEQACKTYDNPADAPPGWSALDWYTHSGLCPDCQDAMLWEIAWNTLLFPRSN